MINLRPRFPEKAQGDNHFALKSEGLTWSIAIPRKKDENTSKWLGPDSYEVDTIYRHHFSAILIQYLLALWRHYR